MKRNTCATLCFAAMLCLSSLSAKAADVLTPCFLKLSLYTNITGEAVTDLTADPGYPASASEVRYLRSFNTRDALPTDALDDYGGRIEGFLTPQESGDYLFFLRSDAQSELWLSTDDTEASASLIAEEQDRGEPFLEPEVGDPATSQLITLTAGQRYFIMVLYKASTGNPGVADVAQVAWRKVGDTTPALSLKPIPGAFLSTLAPDTGGPRAAVTQQPQNVTVEENSKATFTVAVDVAPTNYVCIQWQRNGVNIPRATGTNFTTFIDKADDGAKFRAIVAVPGAFTNSAEATVTVTGDTTRPVLVSAKGGPNRPEVTLTFAERVSTATATNLANYRITATNGTVLGVTEAVLSADRTQVTLKTDAQAIGTKYTVTVTNVADLAVPTANVIAASTNTFFPQGPLLQGADGSVVWEAEDYDRNPDGLWFADTERGVASRGVSMVSYTGAGGSETTTLLEYDIIFTKTGTHIIWGLASVNDGNRDSAWVYLDGQRPAERLLGSQAALTGWPQSLNSIYGWANEANNDPSPMTVVIASPGLHTIGFTPRETGAFLDKFVITSDLAFNPTTGFGAFGPPVTLRQGEPLPAFDTNIVIVTHPVSTQALENTSITLTAAATIPVGTPFSYQWQSKQGSNFADIPGANVTSFTINPLTFSWNGAVLRWGVISPGNTNFSNEATITVIPETIPPELVKATGSSQQRVVLLFSERLNPTPAANFANYRIDGPSGSVAVQAATLSANSLTVVLVTDAQTVGTKYTVTATNLTDTAAIPNVIVKNQAKFYSVGQLQPQGADGLLVFEAEGFDRNLDGQWVENSSRGNPSGGSSVVVPTGADEFVTQLEYDLTFTQTGTNIIWYRASANDGNSDSAWLHIDSARPPNRTVGNQASMTGFSEQQDFVWLSAPQDDDSGQMTFDIPTAGVHTIGMGLREENAFFDKFVITTDPNFNPEDYGPFGPPETRAGAVALPTLAITSPAINAQFNAGASIPITVAISPTTRAISKVEFFSGPNKAGEASTSPYSFGWTTAPVGTHNLTARLTDDVNDTVQSRPVAVVVTQIQGITLAATSSPGGLNLTWVGGAPPYTVQKKTRLSDAVWVDVFTTNDTNATVAIQGESGFFRVTTP